MLNKDINFFGTRKEHSFLKKELLTSVQKTISHGKSLQGKEVDRFEKKFAEIHDKKYAIAVNSCTDALYFSLLSLNLSSEDEVLLPAYSFLATATCVLRVGAKPVFIDVDDNGLMNLDLATKFVTKNTKVLIYVNLFGLMRNPKYIRNFVKSNNLVLVEDNAQAFGASYKNIKSGSVGDISCFSFDPTKVLSAIGSGGMILTNSKIKKEKIISYRYHGKAQNGDFKYLGFNSQMPSLIASSLLTKMQYYKMFRKKRISTANRFIEKLNNLPLNLPSKTGSLEHVFHKFVIRSKKRDGLKKYLENNGIQCMIHYTYILPNLNIFLKYKKNEMFKNAIKLSKESLSIPIHPFLNKTEVEFIIKTIKNFHK